MFEKVAGVEGYRPLVVAFRRQHAERQTVCTVTVNWPSGLSLGEGQLVSKLTEEGWDFSMNVEAAIPAPTGVLPERGTLEVLRHGIEMIGLRAPLKLAEYLAAHPKVAHVHYPGLASHPQHQLARAAADLEAARLGNQYRQAGLPDEEAMEALPEGLPNGIAAKWLYVNVRPAAAATSVSSVKTKTRSGSSPDIASSARSAPATSVPRSMATRLKSETPRSKPASTSWRPAASATA